MTAQRIVVAALSGELLAGIGLARMAWEVRADRIRLRRDRAELAELRRRLENPELPAHVIECLSQFIQATAGMGAGRRLAGQVLADKLRVTLQIPDAALAACMHDILWMLDRITDVPAPDQFRMTVEILAAAATDLCWLELADK